MAPSTTTTTVTTTKPHKPTDTEKPQLKLSVPSLEPPKPTGPSRPYDGLLMREPGPDEDQKENRKAVIWWMHFIGQRDGCLDEMVNWRNQPVFDDEDEFVSPVRRNDSGVDIKGQGQSEEVFEMDEEMGWGGEVKEKEESQFGKGDGPAWKVAK